MDTEIEAKFLNIDPASLREKLRGAGAKLVYPERLMRRKNFDYADGRLEKIGGWIRVRDEGGGKITLSYKELRDRTLRGTKEISLEVRDFDAICNFLLAVGLKNKSYQETRREKWMLGDVEITIDTWPWIPTFVELEASTEEEVKSSASKLGLDWAEALHGSVETAYQKYFDATEAEIDGWEKITFTPVPDWLEAKRRR